MILMVNARGKRGLGNSVTNSLSVENQHRRRSGDHNSHSAFDLNPESALTKSPEITVTVGSNPNPQPHRNEKTMIPAQPGMQVVYREAAQHPHRDELVAWNSAGWPMVFRENSLEAIDPAYVSTIVPWHSDDPHPDFSQFTPVQGLQVLYRGADGSLFDQEAIGWGVTTAGQIVPVVVEDDMVMSASADSGYVTAFREREREIIYAIYEQSAEEQE